MSVLHERRGLPAGAELRTVRFEAMEWRDPGETGGDYATLTGYAAVFEKLSLPLYDWWYGEYQEEIAPGAFRSTLARQPDVHLVYVHDMASAMARTTSKTLDLTEDDRGLRVWANLDPTDPDVQRVAPKMRRRDVDQMSFAFTVAVGPDGQLRQEWHETEEGVTRRILEIGDLFDVSIVPQGAYPQTNAELDQRELRAFISKGLKREGKILSASSRTAIQAAVDTLQELLDSAETERGRAAAARLRELRADMPSLEALVAMHQWGQEFIECEDEPDDGPDRAAMQQILDELEQLIAVEANETPAGRTPPADPTKQHRGGAREPSGADPIAPASDPAGGDTAMRLARLKARARAATT